MGAPEQVEPDLEAGPDQGQRVRHELREAAGQHAGAEDGGGRRAAVVGVHEVLLHDLEARDVHARVRHDPDLHADARTVSEVSAYTVGR